MNATVEAPRHRLFLGLSPDPAARAELAQLARRLAWDSGGRALREDQLHLTLLFLGEVPEHMLAPIRSALDSILATGFPLVGDKLSFRSEHGLILLGVSRPEPGLLRLQRRVRSLMKELGIAYDRKRFHPHITLVRGMQHAPDNLEFVPSHWAVNGFRLIESASSPVGRVHRVIQEWPLQPPPPRMDESMVVKLSPSDVDSIWLHQPLEVQAA